MCSEETVYKHKIQLKHVLCYNNAVENTNIAGLNLDKLREYNTQNTQWKFVVKCD